MTLKGSKAQPSTKNDNVTNPKFQKEKYNPDKN